MDKNKFWLGGRLFNTASPRLGAPTQRKARPQVGHPNAMQGTSASWAPQCTSATQMQGTPVTWSPQCNARHVRKLGAQTQRKASWQDGRPNEKLICNENVHTREHLAKRRAGGWIRTNFGLEVDFLIRPHPGWVPQHNERPVRKMGAQTQRKARLQDGCPNEKLIRKMVTQTQNKSATKTSTQGSTRLKDELEDG
jgi:hypothetical protein